MPPRSGDLRVSNLTGRSVLVPDFGPVPAHGEIRVTRTEFVADLIEAGVLGVVEAKTVPIPSDATPEADKS